MPRKYSFESEPDEQQPLDSLNNQRSPGSRRLQTQPLQQHHIDLDEHEPYYDEPPQAAPQPPVHQQQAQSPRQARQQLSHYPPSSSRTVRNPAFHPDSAYNQLAANRQYAQAPLRTAVAGNTADLVSPVSPPAPPPHSSADSQQPFGRDTRQQQAAQVPQSNITPGADNFSESAAGGMAGIAYSVAERNPRESGVEAMRAMQPQQQQQQPQQMRQQEYQNAPQPGYPQQAYQAAGAYAPQQQYRGYTNSPYDQPEQGQLSPQMLRPAYPGSAGRSVDRDSRSSLQGLGNSGYPPGVGTPGTRTPSRSPHSAGAGDIYTDDPYQRYSMHDTQLGFVNPNEIEDDGDDGLEYGRTRNARTSMLSLAGYSTKSSRSGTASGVVGPATVGAAAVGAAAAGAVAAGMAHGGSGELAHGGDMMTAANIGRSGGMGDRVASSGGARYNALNNGTSEYAGGNGGSYGAGGGYDSGAYNASRSGGGPEKSEWLTQQSHSKKIWKWAIIGGIALAVVAGIVLGVVFGVVLKHKSGSSSSSDSSSTASGDTNANGDLSLNSPEIQKLLNNKNLHKVFPGIDYTPINTQYPDCLANPPSQNNVTRDIAVLSQLTNTIRLYGTDCNQTEMTIHAIKQLQMEDTVKIWMGVWQDNNDTTNARQLAQMWDILDTYGADPFKGVIVANEILFREQMTTSQLSTLLSSVRTNMTAMSISLPVATSDLGTVWDAELAEASDYVMANIHPFFGGVNAKDAASWTWNFWETNNGQFFKSDKSKNIISETGWPSQGGTDCGSGSTETSCPDHAVAGISQINSFLSTWVCDALTNGTEYFWFEAFDEPWKIQYDTGDENWEDHWGIMDVNRNLKSGITIPDCGGKTV
ncbi:hypothetical protein SBRCBS47491_008901 [Sporothrix bragantina]|uniref:glucan endo-1,3-beta-D-glucosidase n=1 Tax=Sporothrix bragantina TaxID=671064 RepID=A0ABP0CSY8_9PEZI